MDDIKIRKYQNWGEPICMHVCMYDSATLHILISLSAIMLTFLFL